jgi:hypothetical protein
MRSQEAKSSASRIVCKGLDVIRVNSAGEAVSSRVSSYTSEHVFQNQANSKPEPPLRNSEMQRYELF